MGKKPFKRQRCLSSMGMDARLRAPPPEQNESDKVQNDDAQKPDDDDSEIVPTLEAEPSGDEKEETKEQPSSDDERTTHYHEEKREQKKKKNKKKKKSPSPSSSSSSSSSSSKSSVEVVKVRGARKKVVRPSKDCMACGKPILPGEKQYGKYRMHVKCGPLQRRALYASQKAFPKAKKQKRASAQIR